MICEFNGTLLTSVLPPLLMTELVLGVVGNGLLLFNLAMADFMLMVPLPFRASYYFSGIKWTFGIPLCNICLFMLALNRTGSSIFLMAIAVDSLQHINTTYCESFMIKTEASLNLNWHKFLFIFSFYMPLLVILYCTIQIIRHLRRRQLSQQRKIKKALCFIAVVAVIFIVCFLPSNITQLIIWIKTQQLAGNLSGPEVCQAMDNMTIVFYLSISLTYLNSVLDPVVYYFSSPTFKNICRKALHLSKVDNPEISEKKTRETGSQSISQL
ncbi:Hydroxycarboxylic acid receptor 3 [Dissostichus eleginoides]|uniref:Hydroxycarboxylic acid receptor 3 n=1 Tax=Dissostichus eleginoides TaxID=100907 RepID=A0AAD9F4J2_DISEL|nr:Hydroxycarboxylic acid receptor 3 [Dissostichus eleginoides]